MKSEEIPLLLGLQVLLSGRHDRVLAAVYTWLLLAGCFKSAMNQCLPFAAFSCG
jgi:hypothetical protein